MQSLYLDDIQRQLASSKTLDLRLVSGLLTDLIIDLGECAFALVHFPYLIVLRVVEHLTEFLTRLNGFGHVIPFFDISYLIHVGIKHLIAFRVPDKFFDALR